MSAFPESGRSNTPKTAETKVRFWPEADVGSRVSQSGSTISTRCIPGPQPSVVVEVALAPNLAKKGADFWLAAILTIFASDVRPK